MPIPKRIHVFWTGRPPGAQERACLGSMRRHHPDWELLAHGGDAWPDWWGDLARPVAIEFARPELERLFHATKSAPLQSDVLRFDLLDRAGGVWLDLDVACLQPLDTLLQNEGFSACESFGLLGSSVVGARAGSAVVRRAIELLLDWFDPVAVPLSPGLLTRAVLEAGADWAVLEPDAFYPWRWSAVGVRVSDCLDGAFAVHLFNSLGPLGPDVWAVLAAHVPEFAEIRP